VCLRKGIALILRLEIRRGKERKERRFLLLEWEGKSPNCVGGRGQEDTFSPALPIVGLFNHGRKGKRKRR